MVGAALWVLAAVVAVGLGLAAMYMLERRVRGPMRLAAWAHGVAGAAGVGLLAWPVLAAPDPGGFGRMAAVLCAAALVAGLAIWLPRRRPAGALVAIHGTLGIAGVVILAAYAALAR